MVLIPYSGRVDFRHCIMTSPPFAVMAWVTMCSTISLGSVGRFRLSSLHLAVENQSVFLRNRDLLCLDRASMRRRLKGLYSLETVPSAKSAP